MVRVSFSGHAILNSRGNIRAKMVPVNSGSTLFQVAHTGFVIVVGAIPSKKGTPIIVNGKNSAHRMLSANTLIYSGIHRNQFRPVRHVSTMPVIM
jgi:hypothetical protein